MTVRDRGLLIVLSVTVTFTLGLAARAGAQEATVSSDEPTTGALRFGIYDDTDQTSVIRSLAVVTSKWGNWSLTGSGGIDVVTSASIDVRSSPGLSKVDVMTGASGRTSTSGGKMTDRRLQVTGGGGWKDTSGHAVSLTSSFAGEADYASVSAGANGSVDVYDRATTLLGGFAVTKNWISSVLDRRFAQQMSDTGYSAGIAQVLSPNDALRLRYDGSVSQGYQASPYRNVRFGNWTTTSGRNQQLTFMNTIGSADGLPELEPDHRVRHAGVLEWVHALTDGVGVHTQARLGQDSWGVRSATASIDLRVAQPGWRLQIGYRFYAQTAADFFQGKYTSASTAYPFYTSDKELGRETGHLVNFDVSTVLSEPSEAGGSRLLLDAHLVGLYYNYPGFVLLDSRASVFAELGLTWEL